MPRKRTKDKRYWLNLNQYRNWHYIVNNQLKARFGQYLDIMYHDIIKTQSTPIRITYTVYYGKRTIVDFSNIAVVVQKFFEDWLVTRDIIPDDNFNFIKEVVYKWGGYEKGVFKCEVEIEEI